MVPFLKVQVDGQVRTLRDLASAVAQLEALSVDQRQQTLASGQPVFENRIGWAASYLKRVGAVRRPAKGQYIITEFGRQLLVEHPLGITELELRQHADDDDRWWVSRATPKKNNEFRSTAADDRRPASQRDFLGQDHRSVDKANSVSNSLGPDEMIEAGVELVHQDVKSELMTRLL